MHVTAMSSLGHTNTTRSNYASTQLLRAIGESDSKHGSYDMKRIAAVSGSSLFLGLSFVGYLPKLSMQDIYVFLT